MTAERLADLAEFHRLTKINSTTPHRTRTDDLLDAIQELLIEVHHLRKVIGSLVVKEIDDPEDDSDE